MIVGQAALSDPLSMKYRSRLANQSAEDFKGLIEALPTALVALVVGFCGQVVEKVLEVLLLTSQQDAFIGVACPEHQPLTGDVDE